MFNVLIFLNYNCNYYILLGKKEVMMKSITIYTNPINYTCL